MAGLSGISMVPRQFVVTADRGHTRQRVILQCRAPVATAHAVVYLLLQGDHASAGQEPAGLAYKYGLDLATLPCQLGRQADLQPGTIEPVPVWVISGANTDARGQTYLRQLPEALPVGFIGVIHGDGSLAPVALVQPESQTLTVIEADQYAGDQIDQPYNSQQANHPAAHDPGKVEIDSGKAATELEGSRNAHRK